MVQTQHYTHSSCVNRMMRDQMLCRGVGEEPHVASSTWSWNPLKRRKQSTDMWTLASRLVGGTPRAQGGAEGPVMGPHTLAGQCTACWMHLDLSTPPPPLPPSSPSPPHPFLFTTDHCCLALRCLDPQHDNHRVLLLRGRPLYYRCV